MTHGQLYHQGYQSVVTAHKTGDMEHPTQAAGSKVGWRESFLSDSLRLNLFQAAWLVTASLKQLVWPQSTLQLDSLRVILGSSLLLRQAGA